MEVMHAHKRIERCVLVYCRFGNGSYCHYIMEVIMDMRLINAYAELLNAAKAVTDNSRYISTQRLREAVKEVERVEASIDASIMEVIAIRR